MAVLLYLDHGALTRQPAGHEHDSTVRQVADGFAAERGVGQLDFDRR
jgi:hypothetical protein